MGGLVVCVLGLAFGMVIFYRLKNMPVHRSMLEVSELIYETCKTYLITQGKFILILELFIGVIMVFYFGVLQHFSAMKVTIILAVQPDRHRGQLRRRLVRHPREHLRELARRVRRPARPAVSDLRDSAAGRHEHRDAAHQRRAVHDALHPAVHPGGLRRLLLHRLRHRRVARRGGAAHRGRHLHEDRRHRRRPDEDRLQHQGRRRAQPRRHRGLHRRQRGRLGRPERRRLRDLRRHRRRAHLVHPRRGEGPGRPGPAARLDLRHARDDGRSPAAPPT